MTKSLGAAMTPIRLTTRQRDLLYHQLSDEVWLTPMMMGGTDGSHHSGTLAQLVRKGLAERSNTGTRETGKFSRSSFRLAICPQ